MNLHIRRSLAWPAVYVCAVGLVGLSTWAAAAAPATPAAEVRQLNSIFAPDTLNIRAGTKVRFLNEDRLAHNVYSRTEGQVFNLGMARPGESVERIFAEPGQIDVRCAVHPRMRLLVIVER